MDHRTYGETRDCKGCRYWSEMLAQCHGGGPVQAMCLSPSSPMKGKYVAGFQRCDQWASGYLGAVDEPGQDPDAYSEKNERQRAAEIAEELAEREKDDREHLRQQAEADDAALIATWPAGDA